MLRFHELRIRPRVNGSAWGGMDIYSLKGHWEHTSVKTTAIYFVFPAREGAERARRGTAQSQRSVGVKTA
jgi:hypothetical protein